MGELSKLTNIGKTVEEQLAGVGIDSVGELKRLVPKKLGCQVYIAEIKILF